MHSEYRRINKESDTAVLFIHGILGTPRHFDDLIALVPERISVYNMLLDGHGRGVRDFSGTSMKKWEHQVAVVIKELSLQHKRIIIAAHSMGTLFSICEAVKNPDLIKGLFFLAVPLKIVVKPKVITNSAKVYFNKISKDDLPALSAKKAYGIAENDKKFWHYFCWLPRYFELFSKIVSTRKQLPNIKTPIYAFQSSKDEMVPLSAARYLKGIEGVRIKYLEKSSHYYYEKQDYKVLLREFSAFLEELLKKDP